MLENYKSGDVINAKVTHLEPFGAFVDIGCGIIGLLSIENISVSRISHPKDRFYVGQNIKVCLLYTSSMLFIHNFVNIIVYYIFVLIIIGFRSV